MRARRNLAACLTTLTLGLLGTINSAPAHASEVPDLNGLWKSISCEVRPQMNQDGSVGERWLTRVIEMKNGHIAAEFTTYTGPGCDVPLQRLDFAGTVTKVGDSTVVHGGIDADLEAGEYVRFTPLAEGFAQFLNSAEPGTCGTETWQVGAIQDVHITGCSVIGLPPNTPTKEFEVLVVRDGHLYFGARPVDGSFITGPEKRPHALQVPLVRAE